MRDIPSGRPELVGAVLYLERSDGTAVGLLKVKRTSVKQSESGLLYSCCNH